MRRRPVLGWLLAGLSGAAALRSGFAFSEERSGPRARPLESFDQIVVDLPANIVIRPGAPNVMVQAAGRAGERIQVSVRGQMLQINRQGRLPGDDLPLIEVFSPPLRLLTVRGSADVDAAGVGVFGERLLVNMAGAGNLHLSDLALTHLELRLSGSGTVHASGHCLEQILLIEGSGSFDAFDLIGDRATIRIPGSGYAQVSVSRELQVSISGSGSVSYRGSPEVREQITGSGSIELDPG